MASIKLHEVTRQLEISNKLAMFFLEKQEIPVKSHSSSVSIEQLELLKDFKNNPDKYKKIKKDYEDSTKKKKIKKKPEKAKELKKIEEIKVEEEKVKEEKVKEPSAEPIKAKEEKPERIIEKKPEPERIIEKKPEPERIPPKPQAQEPKIVKKEVPTKKQDPPSPIKVPELSKKEALPQKNKQEKTEIIKDVPDLIQIPNYITFRELNERLNLRLKDLEEKMELFDKTNLRNKILDEDEVKFICDELKVEVDIIPYEDYIFNNSINENDAKKETKIPVVTIMGHVDHGKTTLLDQYRDSKIAEGEMGGITQSIGAYKLTSKFGDIVFIDTPGHEAFTNMRSRGAKTTDIVILVVAAEDGVMPQTLEAINHAKAAQAPLIVAINKIDLPTANVDNVKKGLSEHDVLVEDWGGDIVSVEISAKNNTNLNALLEMISLVSEMQELKSWDNVLSRGRIIESRLDQQTGATATVLMEHGTLKIGDFFICGNSTGKVKMIFDDHKNALTQAKSVIPVEVVGFTDIPKPGELFQVVKDYNKALKIVNLRKNSEIQGKSEERFEEKKMTLQNLFSKENKEEANVFSAIIKADNFGSAEVLKSILKKEEKKDRLEVNIVHSGIGNIAESDVMLAATSNSMILGFNVKTPKKVLGIAKRESVTIKIYNVIYHLVEDIQKALKGEIKPEYKKELVGKVEVLKLFNISKIGTIAGCLVRDGRVTNKSKLHVIRGEDFLFEGELETLKRIKDEVKEIKAGTECGIKIKNFNDLQVGDVFEVYEMVEKK